MLEITSGLAIVLLPMALGYLIVVRQPKRLAQINHIVLFLLYIILFIMGITLGQLDDLGQKLPLIGFSAFVLCVSILICNIIGLIIYDKLSPIPTLHITEKMPSQWRLLIDSSKLCLSIVLGCLVGIMLKPSLQVPHGGSIYALIAMIFFVGIQLRNSGISLRTVVFNQRGFCTAVIFCLTSLFGGILAALTLSIPITQGLAFASGFGWYSLSSVVLTNAWGPMQGSIAFLNDLLREIFSLFMIPFFMRHFRSTAVGIAGATALDCTLPIIQRAGGIEVVPLAISFGVITNILPPILLIFFSRFPL